MLKPPDWYTDLLRDVETADEMVKKDDSQFARRVFLRSLVSLIEANLYMTRRNLARRLAARFEDEGYTIIPLLAILQDERPELTNKGKIRLRPAPGDLPTLTRFIVRLYAYLANSTDNYFGNQGWEAYTQMIRIRNRVTHPKTEEHILVSDQDLATIRAANAWFMATFNALLLTDWKNWERVKPNEQPPESENLDALFKWREERLLKSERQLWETFIDQPFPSEEEE